MPPSLFRLARSAKAHALLLATLLTSGWQSPVLARDAQTIAGEEQVARQIEINVANLDPGVAGKQVRRHHRFDETLFSDCDDVGSISDLPQRQFEDCVQRKREEGEVRENCARNAQSCSVNVGRHAGPIPRHRPNYGARTFP